MEEIQGSILRYRVPPLRPTYTCERRTTFAKAYGIEVRCYWELFGKHVRNLGTLCVDHPATPPAPLPPPPPLQEQKEKGKSLHEEVTVNCPTGK
jgi:hypothetical protein